MAGFDNEVIYGSGLDLSGSVTVSNKLNIDGAIYIGSSTTNPQATVPTSSDNTLNVVVGPGTLDFKMGSGTLGTFLQRSNNLSDLTSVGAARNNLGLGSIVTFNSPLPVVAGGTGLSSAGIDGVFISSHTGVPSWLANSATPGYVLTAQTGVPPSWQQTTLLNGFVSWGGAGNYFDDTTLGSFTVLRPGTGYVQNVLTSWTAPQTITGLTAGTTWIIYMDSTGTIRKTSTESDSLFNANIMLFLCLRDSTSPTNNQLTCRENHPASFTSSVAIYNDDAIGTVLSSVDPGGTITLNGTVKIQINGANILLDSGLDTTIPDSGGVAVSFYQYFTLAGGAWARYTSSDTFGAFYNNAGTVTALGANKFGVYTLYAGKDNLNSSTPIYIAVLDTTQYNTANAAQSAISAGTTASATNELAALELAQLGYIIFGQAAGQITNVIVSKKIIGTTVVQNATSITTTQFDVLVGGAGNTIASVGPGSAGQALLSGGNAANPAYSTPTYPSASGTAGKVLVSDGTNNVYSTPTFPNVSATLNKVIKSDGTNWIASTETYAAPGTSGNFMISDGTNWTSSAPTGVLLVKKVTLTNAQLKSINSSPVTVIPAQGANTILQPVWIAAKFAYGGNNAFTGGGTLAMKFNNAGISLADVFANGTMTGTAVRWTSINITPLVPSQATGVMDNVGLTFSCGVGNYGGNAANDNTVVLSIAYYVATLT